MARSMFIVFIITISLASAANFAIAKVPAPTCEAYCGDTSAYDPPARSRCLCNPLWWNSILDFVQGIINYIYWLAIPISAIMLMWSGWLFMTSAGDPAKLKQAKQALIYAAIGVVIIMISVGGVDLIKDILNRLGKGI